MESLEALSLVESKMTITGFRHLQGLRRLRMLDLSASPITDDSSAAFVELIDLKELRLRDTNIGDATVRNLVALQSLESLALDRTKITDRGVAEACRMTHLRFLGLSNTGISHAGLDALKRSPSLGVVDIRFCSQISREMVVDFRRECEAVRLYSDFD
jgi:hypothetical protein